MRTPRDNTPACRDRWAADLASTAWALARAAVALVLCLCLADGVGAGERVASPAEATNGSASPPAALRFQRVFVPADRIDQRASGGRYLPMDAAQFEELLKQANAADAAGSPRIASAEYRASLADDGLLQGTARLQVDAAEGRAVLLSLGAAGLPMRDARWQDSRSTTTLGAGEGGDVRLLVEKPGQLQFAWSLAGRPDEDATRQFDLNLPPNAKTTLVLDLPDNVTATCDPGIQAGRTTGVASRKTWRFELGGRRRATLRIARADAAATDRQPDAYVSLVYALAEEGLDLKADLRIEGTPRPPRCVALALDPGLELVTAQYGQTPVNWSVFSVPGEPSTRVVVELPETSQGTPRVLHLAAMGPVALDRPWRLPRIRPEDAFWREGSATLAVPSSLSVERLVPVDCRQSRSTSLSTSEEGDKSEFQFFSPDATVEVVVSRLRAPIQVDYGVNVELDGSEAAGRLTALFQANGHERFELVARVEQPWIVDTVDCDEPGQIRDWTQSPAADSGARLVIRLAKALSPGQKALKINVTGRRLQSPLGRGLRADELTPVHFAPDEYRVETRVLAVRARSPYDLSLRGDDRLRRIAPDQLDPRIRELPSAKPGDLVFLHDLLAETLQVELAQKRPGYACGIRVAATVSRRTLFESYHFACEPRSSPMDHALIHFFPARDAPLQWSLGPTKGQPLAARRLTTAEQAAAGVGREGETWSISLRPARSEPFEIRARRATALGGKTAVSLAALPKADSQTAEVVIRAEGDVPLEIVNRRLDPIPTKPPPAGEYQTARATFRYRPEQIALSSPHGAVTVAVGARSDAGAMALVWDARIDSRFAPCGGSGHLVTYCLENAGRPRFGVTMRTSAERRRVREVRIDGQGASWRRETDASGNERLVIDLPPGRRFPVVAIDFSDEHPPLGLVDTLEPPRLEPDVPVMAARWVAWVPAGHRALGAETCRETGRESGFSWRRRLFGPLGRSVDASPFNPLAARDWRDLLRVGAANHSGTQFAAGDSTTSGAAVNRPSTDGECDTIGWNSHCLELGGSRPVQLRVVHNLGIEITRWVAFLAAVGLGMWAFGNRPARLATAAAIGALLAILLPVVPATVASGGLLGMLFCLAAWLLRRWPGNHEPASPPVTASSPSSRRTTAMGTDSLTSLLLAAAFLFGSTAAAFAADTPPNPNRDRKGAASSPNPSRDREGAIPVQQVLIPVDKQRKPSGGNVLVPESFYRRLTRAASAGRRGASGWLIERATYRGNLEWDAATRRLTPGEIRAYFHVRAFDATARVRIPLDREQLALADPWAFLDGRAIEPEWESDGRAIRVAVPAEGYYRLELVFTPAARTPTTAPTGESAARDEQGFDVRIPPAPNSRLELALPAGAPAVTVPSARGRIVRQDQELHGDLGGAGLLSVRWPTDSDRPIAPPVLEADQLLWLNVTPGSVLVDARFHVRVLQGRVSEIRLAADPRLTLLGSPSIGRVESVPGSPGQFRVKLPAPRSDHFTLAARFSVQDASGVGRHRVPLVTVEDARIAGRWFAVSVDESLQYTEHLPPQDSPEDKTADRRPPKRRSGKVAQDAPALESVAVPDFLATWGDAEWTARAAYRFRDAAPPWSMASRPKAGRTVVDQQLTASIAETQAELRYGARINTSAGHGFRYRLDVPPQLQIDALTVHEDGADRLARWSRAKDGSIDLTLTAPAAAERHLTLRGHMAVPAAGAVDIPIPAIEDAESRFFRVTLLRESGVSLELEQCEGFEEAEPEVLSAEQSERSRLFVSLINSGHEKPRVRLRVAPNRPKLDVRQTLSMEAQSGAWAARLRLEIEPRGGVADEMRLIVPAELADPVEIEPPASVTQTVLPGGGRELVLRAPRPITDSQQWSLLFPLVSDRVAAADVAVAGAYTQERRLVLPRRLGGRALRWDTQRLEKESSTEDVTTYKIVGKDFRAALSPPGGAARISLADVRLAWAEDATCRGVVHFELEGVPRDWCPLVLPKNFRIVQITVDGVPTSAAPGPDDDTGPNEARRFRIPLGSPALPGRITIAFTGRLPAGLRRASCTFDVPRLGALPVEKSIWTLSGPPDCTIVGRPDASRALLDVLRADSLISAIQRAANGDAAPSDKLAWAHGRRDDFGRIESALAKHVVNSESAAVTQAVDKTLHALRRHWTALDTSCNELNGEDKSDSSKRPGGAFTPLGPAGRFPETDESGAGAHRIVAVGLNPLTLGYRRANASSTAAHVSAVALWGVLFALGYVGAVHGAWSVFARRWPEGFLVAAGVAWWLVLSPSVAGLGIVVLGVWLTIRFAGRRLRPDDPTAVSAR